MDTYKHLGTSQVQGSSYRESNTVKHHLGLKGQGITTHAWIVKLLFLIDCDVLFFSW